MPHYSRSPGTVLQRSGEDLAALTSERVTADAREAALLARLGLTLVTPTGASLRLARQIAGELLAMDAAENAGHAEALAISRQLAGEFEAWNRAAYERTKKSAGPVISRTSAETATHLDDSTAGRVPGHVGGDSDSN